MSENNPATGPITARSTPKSTDNTPPAITAHSPLISLRSLMAVAISRSRDDGPGGDQVEKEDRGQLRHDEGDQAREDAGHSLDEQKPAGRPSAGASEDAHYREHAVDQGVGAEQEDQCLQGYPGRRSAASPKSMAMAPRSARAHQCPASAGNAACGWVIPSSFFVAATRASRCKDAPFVRHTLYARTQDTRYGRPESCGAAELVRRWPYSLTIAAGSFGPVEGGIGGVGQFLVGGSVLGVAGDAYGDGRPG